jgi:hypothetical protein
MRREMKVEKNIPLNSRFIQEIKFLSQKSIRFKWIRLNITIFFILLSDKTRQQYKKNKNN